MRLPDLMWLAGLLEGEGCFTWAPAHKGRPRVPLIQLIMNDKDVVERAAHLMEVATVGVKSRQPPKQSGWRIRIQGYRAVRLMRQLRPHMGERRGARIDELLAEAYGQVGVEAAERLKSRVSEERVLEEKRRLEANRDPAG